MKITEILTELRKNPKQNPKITSNTELLNAASKMMKDSGNARDLFISFTSIDKLGINPQSKYKTPIGIYSYPAAYVIDKVANSLPMEVLPFAGENEYATIFKCKGNIIDIDLMDNEEANNYYKKIAEYWSQQSGKDWKTSVDEVENIINSAEDKSRINHMAGGRFWYVTMKVSKLLGQAKAQKKFPTGLNQFPPSEVSWNKLLRAIGIDGIVDNGFGIIHTSEPYQAVFFSIDAIDVVKQVYNKPSYLPNEIDKSTEQGNLTKEYMTSKHKQFRFMNLNDQKKWVRANPTDIRFMPNPPEDFQFEVCKQDPAAIVGIRNPSEKLQLYLVNIRGPNISYILKTVRKPSQAVQIAALKGRSSADAMYVFEQIMAHGIWPTPAVQMAAVSQDFEKTLKLLTKYKFNPSQDVRLEIERQIERRKHW